MKVVRLGPGEETRLRTIRLAALRESPDAFGSTAAEVATRPPESWTQQLAELPTFVAVSGGEDAGIVRYAPDDKNRETGWLISMWVSPEHRRKGVGSALIDAVVNLAKSKGVARLALDVGEQNETAIALYASKGFEATGETSTLDAPCNHVCEHRRVLRLT